MSNEAFFEFFKKDFKKNLKFFFYNNNNKK